MVIVIVNNLFFSLVSLLFSVIVIIRENFTGGHDHYRPSGSTVMLASNAITITYIRLTHIHNKCKYTQHTNERLTSLILLTTWLTKKQAAHSPFILSSMPDLGHAKTAAGRNVMDGCGRRNWPCLGVPAASSAAVTQRQQFKPLNVTKRNIIIITLIHQINRNN